VREDMAQVVIERPRYHSSGRYHDVRPRGVARLDLDRLADLPRGEGMRRPHVDRKTLSDLLGPLRKFLVRQVGRPWNKVYSEICERISPNSTTQLHILGHLDDLIETKTRLAADGRVERCGARYRWRAAYVDEIPGQLYVHPVSGLVRRTAEARVPWRYRPKPRGPEVTVVGHERELWRRDGIWYWAVFAHAAPRLTLAADGKSWTYCPADCFTGHQVALGARYRAGKRQASRRDLRRYGLVNHAPAE
jgi:hypothetical protein